ncbi:hypothetical protein FQR65_LT20409 [Abscondita terminalis]|nr:hypothetical protein FQR65_LT20409 [Abscondita terminalis]
MRGEQSHAYLKIEAVVWIGHYQLMLWEDGKVELRDEVCFLSKFSVIARSIAAGFFGGLGKQLAQVSSNFGYFCFCCGCLCSLYLTNASAITKRSLNFASTGVVLESLVHVIEYPVFIGVLTPEMEPVVIRTG